MTVPYTHRLRPLLAALLLLLAAEVASALPASYSTNLSFGTGTQSLWGPGQGTASFGADDSVGVPQVNSGLGFQITPAVGASYDFSASSGDVSASVSGNLSASYDDYLAAPGTASIGVGFTPTGGGFSTDLGARANLEGYVHHIPFGDDWDFCFYCRNWSLETGSSATPGFGVTRSGSDSVSVAGVGPEIPVVASAQANLNATQTSRLRLDAFTGLLTYTNRDTGTSGVTALALSGSSVLDVDLTEAGDWDFSFLDLDLDSTFWSTMGASITFDIDVFGVIGKTWNFANIDLLDTARFALDFGERSVATAFSIHVPEPGTALLLGSGLLGLAAVGGRGRRTA